MLSADSDASWELLAKHLAGEGTSAEEVALRAWAAADSANLALLLSATRTWEQATLGGAGAVTASAIAFSPTEVQHAWQRFETTVLGPAPGGSAPANTPTAPSAPAPGPAAPTLPGAGWWVGAGKGLGLLAVGLGAGWLLRTAVPAEPAVVAAPMVEAAASAPSVSRPAAPVDLVFEDAPLGTVARRLEGAFPGTHVVVADSALAGQRFTGTFRAAQPGAVLRVVGVATGATLARRPDSTWVLGR